MRGYDSSMSREDAQRRGRVLFLVENASVPNDTRVWSECLAAQEAGFDVTVISPEGTDRDTARLEIRDGIEIHRFRVPSAERGHRASGGKYSQASQRTRRTE